MRPGSASRGETLVAEPGWLLPLLWVGFPLLGAGVGWLLTLVASWLTTLSWVPFQGLFRLVDTIDRPLATIGALGLGVVVGLVLAYLSVADMLTVTVADDRVSMIRGDKDSTIERAEVTGAFVDGGELVLLGAGGAELVREKSDLDRGRLADAFQTHGYPWLPDGDPYADQYRRWVEDLPDLPAGADALLRARAKALRDGDDTDAAELRQELARLGVVVRDRNKRQYWRRAG